MFKKINPAQFIIYFSVLFFAVTLIYFGVAAEKIAPQSQENVITYYLDLAYTPFKKAFLWSVVFVLLALTLHLIIFFINLFRNQKSQKLISVRHAFRKIFIKFLIESKTALKFALPSLLSLFLLTLTLGKANLFNKSRLKDGLIAELDLGLTGNYPFFSLHTIQYPKWFIYLVTFSFSYLVFFMIIFAFYIFYKNARVFKELTATFCLGLVFMSISWFVVPVLSPQDRYIDNIYKLPVPEKISTALTNYEPQKEVEVFMKKVRERKENLKALPTSTLPSAHVFWAVIFGYYLYLVDKKSAFIFTPILALSSFGTFFLAQHYFIDMPAGILFAIFTIIAVRYFLRRA